VRDLTASGVRLVLAAPNVPVGDYTRRMLAAVDKFVARNVGDNVDMASLQSETLGAVAGVMRALNYGQADA